MHRLAKRSGHHHAGPGTASAEPGVSVAQALGAFKSLAA